MMALAKVPQTMYIVVINLLFTWICIKHPQDDDYVWSFEDCSCSMLCLAAAGWIPGNARDAVAAKLNTFPLSSNYSLLDKAYIACAKCLLRGKTSDFIFLSNVWNPTWLSVQYNIIDNKSWQKSANKSSVVSSRSCCTSASQHSRGV